MARKAAQPGLRINEPIESAEKFAKIIMLKYNRYEFMQWALVIDGKVPNKTAVWNKVELPRLTPNTGATYQKALEEIFNQLPEKLMVRIQLEMTDGEFRINLCNAFRQHTLANATDVAVEAGHVAEKIIKTAANAAEANQLNSKAIREITAGLDNVGSARERYERMAIQKDEAHTKAMALLYQRLSDVDREKVQLMGELQQARMDLARMAATSNAVTLASHAAISMSRALGWRTRIEQAIAGNDSFDEPTKKAIRRWVMIEEHLQMMPAATRAEIEGAFELFENPTTQTEELMIFMKLGKELMALPEEKKAILMELIGSGQVMMFINQSTEQLLAMQKMAQQQIGNGEQSQG